MLSYRPTGARIHIYRDFGTQQGKNDLYAAVETRNCKRGCIMEPFFPVFVVITPSAALISIIIMNVEIAGVNDPFVITSVLKPPEHIRNSYLISAFAGFAKLSG